MSAFESALERAAGEMDDWELRHASIESQRLQLGIQVRDFTERLQAAADRVANHSQQIEVKAASLCTKAAEIDQIASQIEAVAGILTEPSTTPALQSPEEPEP